MAKQTGKTKVPPQKEIAPQGVGPATGGQETTDNLARLEQLQRKRQDTPADNTTTLQQAAFAIVQEAVSDLWAALKEPDLQLKVNAIQAWLASLGQAQMMGAEESDPTQFEGIEAVKLLLEQLARAGDGQYALQAAVLAQSVGVPVPSVSKPAVDAHIAEAAAKKPASGPAPAPTRP